MLTLNNLDIIQIKSALASVERFLLLVQACPDDDMPQEVLELVQAGAAIASLKCGDIDAILEKKAVHMVREAGEA